MKLYAATKRILRLVREELRKRRQNATFERLLRQPHIYLYAGDLPNHPSYDRYVGLSLSKSDHRHILHDVTSRLPLPEACVDVYQSEDVFEHVVPTLLPAVINEIYRVLKPGGLFRLSLPDYRCDLLQTRTRKENGELVFDPGGGGSYEDGKVVGGGHVWFPRYETVKSIIDATKFTDITFYHYYDSSGSPVTKRIDYLLGHVMRTPDHDERVRAPYRPMSIVVDCRK